MRDMDLKRERGREHDARRAALATRLSIALTVLEEYGCLWEYEQTCLDHGIPDPLALPRRRVKVLR